MSVSKRIVLLLFFLGELIINTQAYTIKKLGVEHGLSNNNIASFAQDRDGFIWVATKDGLNRLDANSFKVFKNSESDKNSLCNNSLNFIYADPNDDIIWIATEQNGIDAYNYKTNHFQHYEHDFSFQNKNSLIANEITYITGDEEGNLWLATYTAGIDYFNKKTEQFTHYNQTNVKGLGSDNNRCIMYDTTDRIYVGHVGNGFSIIDLKTNTAINYKHEPDNPASLADNAVSHIFKDSGNNIWIATRNGLTLFDPLTGQMTNFKNDPDNFESLSHNNIISIIETDEHQLWIGTAGGGINILDLDQISKNTKTENVVFNHIWATETPEGLSSASARSMLQDSFGNIWMGGYISGVNFISKSESPFERINYLPYEGNTNSLNSKIVPGICFDGENNMWVANGLGGISIYREGNKIKEYLTIPNDPKPLDASSVFKDSDNHIWIGTYDGRIFHYNPQTDRFNTSTCFKDLVNVPISSLFEDSKHNLWVSTDVGLYKYNRNTDNCTIYTTENSAISDNDIRTVAEDSEGNIWVGTLGGGLWAFDQDFNLVHNYGKYYDFFAVNYIYRNSKNQMLIGSQNGLFIFPNQSIESAQKIGKKEGLAENAIRAIVEGRSADEIWISTTNWISYINLKSRGISNFDPSDGIAMGDYLNGSVFKSEGGTIYMGAQSGITFFNQTIEQLVYSIPESLFTGIQVTNNSKQNISAFTDFPYSDSIFLKHNQNSFQINFNVPDFSLTDEVEFMFQMKGLDDIWYLINKEKQVTFRNLAPGKYVFKLKTKLDNTDWPESFTAMHISIAPPFWLSWWAKTIYLLLVLSIVYFIIRFYKQRLELKNSILFEKKRMEHEKELNEEKIKFYTNITHELRTPMTLILGPLEDIISNGSLSQEQLKPIISIQSVANRLLHLINQILEFRKSEIKTRKLRVVKEDFVKNVFNIGRKYQELSQNKEIDFGINLPDMKIEMLYDPEVITIILDNLLSNAFKYTQKGIITLEVKNYNEDNIDYTELIVSDSGYGISEEDLPHIFERYYQAKNTNHPVSGTGIGLALVKKMVELHEADIVVESHAGVGTSFKIRFLTNNSYPEVIHIDAEKTVQEEKEEDNSKDVILVVEDNKEINEYIKNSLTDTYQVITAENGQSGYEVACERIPDLIISDIMMPVLDGIEMCRTMKEDVRTCHIPIILLTAKGSMQDKSEGYSAGADSYLTKPFSINLLKSRIKNILKAREKLSTVYSSDFKNKQLLFNKSTNQLDKEFLEKLTNIIEDNLNQEEMNVSSISSQLNMSHSTLYRKIKALTNLTANEYIRKVRLNVGEQLLVTNQYTISEIMYKIGINSSSYFRQCFKDEFGMNPSDYLQKLKVESPEEPLNT